MINEFEEVIKKNLPAQVGELLQKELKELHELRRQKKELEETIVQKNEIIAREYAKNSELQLLVKSKEELEEREKQLNLKEFELKLILMEKDLSCEKEKTALVSNTLNSLVRNTDFRKTIYGSKTDLGISSNSNNGYSNSNSVAFTNPFNSTEIIKEE